MSVIACARDAALIRQMLDFIDDGLIIIRPDGTIEHANTLMATVLGYTQAEMNGRPWADIVAAESLTEAMAALERTALEVDTPGVEVTLLSKSKNHYRVFFEGIALKAPGGETAGIFVIAPDVRKQIEVGDD